MTTYIHQQMICHIFYPLSTSWLSNMNLNCIVILYHNPWMHYHINPKERHRHSERKLFPTNSNIKSPHRTCAAFCCFKHQRPAEHLTALVLFFPGIKHQLSCSQLATTEELTPASSRTPSAELFWNLIHMSPDWLLHPMEKAIIFGGGGGVRLWFNTGYSCKFQKSYKKR